MLLLNPFVRGMLAAVVIGLVVIITWLFYRSYSDYHFVSWKKIQSFLDEVTRSLRADEFQPVLIVGIGRGGTMLAAMLGAHFPGALVLTSARPGRKKQSVNRRGKKALEEEEEEPTIEIPSDVAELVRRRTEKFGVLLVTDAVYSGSTLYAATGAIQDLGFSQIRTLAYGMRPGTSHPPDFFNVVTKRRIHMPWGKMRSSSEKI